MHSQDAYLFEEASSHVLRQSYSTSAIVGEIEVAMPRFCPC